MTTYPLEAGEAEPFVPASLAHLPDPPTFYLRWGTPREKEQQRRVMDEEGAVMHAEEAMRGELLKGMRKLFSEEDFAAWEPVAKSWWDARDAHERENKDVPADEQEAFVFDREDMLIEILEQVARDWRPYRLMTADNNAYQRMLGHVINSVIIERFENVDVPVQKRGRYLTFDSARALAEKLDRLGREHAADAVLRPAQELGLECMKRLYLDKDAEKNSASPAPSDPTPDTSKTGAGEKSGSSKASARSKRTRAGASATPSGT
ncbi:hypothetical protein [Novosphingobium sp. KN65.2]|uniref:hypothetical protein n=1 Tax=Novosphingobium sp. KN65.2 TaxID=1478134 RepID=UPI0005E25AE9|nr:hypothetical protein [Novosphingobium sp. KN65.2]CDO34044.1 hypothetical protein SPHV1_100078 [Novosphingobium sp. KN65.2]